MLNLPGEPHHAAHLAVYGEEKKVNGYYKDFARSWATKRSLLDYAANPQKTEYFSTADMQRLIGYTQNKIKPNTSFMFRAFNCMPQNAYCIMQATKQR